MQTKGRAVLVAAAALLVTSCAAGTDEPSAKTASSETSSTAASPAEAADPTKVGDGVSATAAPAILKFTAETLDGEKFDGTTLAGKPAVFWFWAPWCPTCRAQSSGVSDLGKKYDGKVNVVGVGGLDEVGPIKDYAKGVDNVTHLVDGSGEVWKHFAVTAQSTYVVVDARGAVVADGYLDDSVLADKVAKLVG